MQNILFIQSSPRGSASISSKVGRGIVDQLIKQDPKLTVIHRDLANTPAPHLLQPEQIAPFFTPAENHSATDKELIRYSNEAIQELMKADIIVIATGMYSFTVSSVLKSWFDQVSRAKITFQYTPQGPEGLVKGKKVYLALASGGVYSEGPAKSMDFVLPYLISVLGFLGMTDVTVVRVEGAGIAGFQEDTAIKNALDSTDFKM